LKKNALLFYLPELEIVIRGSKATLPGRPLSTATRHPNAYSAQSIFLFFWRKEVREKIENI
jgi:hypothetical protein